MADLKKTVEIIFGGKNELSQTIGAIEKDFSVLNSTVSSITSPLAGIADSVVKTDAALAALAIGGLAYAVKTAGEFNGKFGEISTLIKDSGAPIDQFRKDILDYSTSSVKSISDINQAIYNAISAGVDYKSSIAFVNEAEKLSVAGRAGLDATTKVLISTLNAYGESTNKAGKYSDIMFTTVRLGQTTLEELSSSLAMVTGLAATSNIPFETLSAAIAALTVAGLPTSQAITGIRQAIQNIIKPTAEAEKTAASLGLQFNDTALKTRGFEGVLNDAYKATGGNIGKMGELFGSVESLNAVMILGADKTGKFKDALKEMGDSAGATKIAYDKVAQEFDNINQRLANSFKVTLIEIGQKFMPEYGQIAGGLSDLMKGIKVGVDSGAFDPLFNYLDSVAGSIAIWLKGVAEAFPEALSALDFNGLIAALKDLGEAMGGYLGDLDITKADDLAAVLQLVVDIITGLINVTTGMVDAFRPFASTIVDFFTTMAKGGPETQETIGKILAFSKAIEGAGLGVVGAIMAIDEFGVSMRGLFDTIAGGTTVLWNGFEILLTAIKGMTIIVGGLFVNLLDNLTFGMLPGLDTMKAKLTSWGETIGDSFVKNGTEAAAGLSRLGDGLMRLGSETGTSRDRVAELKRNLTELPSEKTTSIKMKDMEETTAKVAAINKEITELPDLRTVGVKVLADGTSIEKANNMIIERFPDGRILLTNVGVEADAAGISKVQKTLDAAIPKDKQVDIQTKLDVEKIKGQADIIQKSIEWKAKLDIAQVEAAAKALEATFKSIDTSIVSTGDTLSAMLGSYVTALGQQKGGTGVIEQAIKDENDRRNETFELQKGLVMAEADNLKARTESMRSGNAMITINGAGLQPHLEAFMFEILSAIQVQATAEGQKFLVGI
ncbi:MAG: phage tail tape measure protein [Syntrophales bacterium]|jgi:TP901 family phage tail tape measure protein|nr:phage tail tape measure protein [Syntrophales bacterium]